MTIDPITALFETGKSIIERVWPDKTKQAEELRKLTELKQSGDIDKLKLEIDLITRQIDVNIESAKSSSLFVAGGRPFILWICGAGLAYSAVIYPLLMWLWSVLSVYVHIPQGVNPPPHMDGETLTGVLTGLLGLGGFRTIEKIKKVSRDNL